MPKLSRSILKRIEERPYQEKLKFAGWRRIQVPKQGRPAVQGVKVLAAELKKNRRARYFSDKWLLIPEGEDADPYKIERDGKIYEFWREGDNLQIRTSIVDVDLGSKNGRGRKTLTYVEPITRESFRTGHFVNRGGRGLRASRS